MTVTHFVVLHGIMHLSGNLKDEMPLIDTKAAKFAPSPAALPVETDSSDVSLVLKSLPESEPTKRPSRSWRKIAFFTTIGVIGLGILAMIIALSVVLGHRHRRARYSSPSYHQTENKPILAIQDFPDPGLIQYNGTWFAYGTDAKRNNAQVPHVPVATSRNFVNWTLMPDYDTLPTLAPWESRINHWAPNVIQRVCGENDCLASNTDKYPCRTMVGSCSIILQG